MSFTFTTLKTAIQDYTDNSETTFVNNLTTFIVSAEERILKNVQLSLFRKNSTGSTSNANKYLALPSDFLTPFSLSIISSSEHVFLDLKDVNFVQSFNPNPATTGTPRYYAIFDYQNLILAPTPDSAYTAELHYFYRPTSITTSGDGSSWLGTNAPNTLLYGSLVEAYTFMKGEADIQQLYGQRFEEAILALKNFGEAKEVTDQYRSGMIVRQKQ
jgi:hypothetical protein|tara:strand:- start:1297 stop:1941 length:645 start_codon:yes stop_codon:yes gene_type:complete